MYIAAGQGLDNARGHILMSTETSCRFGHLLQVSKNLSEVWFYAIFFMILHMYMPWGWQPLGHEIFMSSGTSCHFDHMLQVSKKSIWSLIFYTIFFVILYMYIACRRGSQPHGDKVLMSTEMSCHFIHLLQVSVEVLILYIFFHDLIHVYSPGTGADSPRGQNFDVNGKALSLYPFVASFKEISLKSDFIQFFSWFNTCIYPRGR